jgi:hypothetical protein
VICTGAHIYLISDTAKARGIVPRLPGCNATEMGGQAGMVNSMWPKSGNTRLSNATAAAT